MDAATRAYATFPRRMRALVIDTAVAVVFLLVGLLALEVIPGDTAGLLYVILTVTFVLTYEPALVSTLGGTIGHRAINLRVCDQRDNRRLGFFRALLRMLAKAVLGIFSFFFMAITRRHQALHDILSKSVVVVHHPELAAATDFVLEMSDEQLAVANVSAMRRVMVILAYGVFIFALVVVTELALVSQACFLSDECTRADNRIFAIAGWIMLVGFGAVLVQGWRGRLPGARHRALRPTDVDERAATAGHENVDTTGDISDLR